MVGFVFFGLNWLNISFIDYLFGLFISNLFFIFYKLEFEWKFCVTVRIIIVVVMVIINGKDVELLKVGVIE